MEPAVGIDGLCRGLRLLVIAGGNGLATQQDFVLLANLYLQIRHDFAYRPYHIACARVTANRSGALRQSVTHHHVDAYRVDKLADLVGDCRTGSRKERAVFDADGLLEQCIDRTLIELILQMEHHGRRLAQAQIVQVVRPSSLDGIQHHGPFQARLLFDALVYPLIYLLPKTGYAAHGCRTNLLDGGLNILRTQIDAHLRPPLQADIRPATLEDVRQRQKVHRHILIGELRDTNLVRAECLQVVVVHQQYTLRLACSTRRIKYVADVLISHFRTAALRLSPMCECLALLQEFAEVNGGAVARITLDGRVEYDNLL